MAIDWEAVVGGPAVAVFGDPAIYTPADSDVDAFEIVGVFDAQYRETQIIDGLSYTSDAMPVIGVNDAQFVAAGWSPGRNDQVLIQQPGPYFGRRYIVKDVQPDSHGVSKLILNEMAPA